MAFATKRRFGGRRAAVGDRVLLAGQRHDDKPGICLRAGLIVAVSGSQDRPYIYDYRTNFTDWTAPAWEFIDIEVTDAKQWPVLDKMPLGTWTWLPLNDSSWDPVGP